MSEYYFKPAHVWQDWEKYDPEKDWNPDSMIQDYTYQNEWHSVITIQLGELIESGVFDWSRPELDWSSAAYDDEQYSRVCAYFIERFRFREISMLPVLEWFYMIRRKLVYELMPKYSPMYAAIAEGFNPLAKEDEFYKSRRIDSQYPETMLSENSDYISNGTDEENERVLLGAMGDNVTEYAAKYKGVDELLLDDLESMFVSMYTSHVDGF